MKVLKQPALINIMNVNYTEFLNKDTLTKTIYKIKHEVDIFKKLFINNR